MSQQTNQVALSLRDNAVVRWSVLIVLSLAVYFAYMFVDVLSPISSKLEGAIGWDNSTYGTYSGSTYFLNVFVGFLILAGIILDKMGIRFTAVLSGSLMVLGAFIKVYALSSLFVEGNALYDWLSSWWTAFPASAKLASLGFMIFGCGSEMSGVMVSRAIVRWFEGKELALAMGINMAVARLGVFSIFWLSPYLYKTFGSVNTPVIVCAILLAVGLILFLAYGVMDKKLDAEIGEDGQEEEPFKFSDLRLVFGKGIFWLVALLCVLYYSAIFPFQKFASEMLETRVGFDLDFASMLFSLFPVGAVFVTPILGTYLDRVGKGATMLIIGSLLMVGCHLIFALYPFAGDGSASDTAVATGAIITLGVSFSLVPATLWPSVPKLIDNKVLGSAYSGIFWIQNIGLMCVPILIGSILQATDKNYTIAMLVFATFGAIALAISLILKMMDAKKGYGLELPNVK